MKYKNAFPYFSESDIDAIINQVKDILSGNGLLTKGPKVKEFEKAYASYTGSQFAIATNSCTTALEIVLKSIGLQNTDEVIVPSQTFIATGSSVISAGGKVIFCETDDDFSLDFEDLKEKITRNTKAVIIVHFAGLIHPNILEIRDYLKENNIYLIEDCAHSNGASINGIMSGAIGDFGCHSFYSTKIITTGEGGMITTNNEDHFKKCSSLRSIGIDINSSAEIFTNIGSNNRMAEFESILGLSQLNRLEEFVEHRIKIASIYKSELNELLLQGTLRFQHVPSNIRHPYWKFIVFLNSNKYTRSEIQEKLLIEGVNIEAPYQPLMHLQPVFKNMYLIKEGDLPKTEKLIKSHFCLPIHFKISEKDAKIISNIIKRVLSE